MNLRSLLFFRCLTAAALLMGVFGALLVHISFSLQLTRECEALSKRSAALSRSMEAAAVNYAVQSISLTDELIVRIAAQTGADSVLYGPDGLLLSGQGPDIAPETGLHISAGELAAVRSVRLGDRAYTLLVRSETGPLFESRRLMLIAYAALYFLVILLFALAMHRTAQSCAAPLERLTGVSIRLAEGSSSARADTSGFYEADVLAASFNRMADALTGQIDRQKRFIANLSHEMKTPLAAMIGHADLIRSGRVSGEEALLSAHRILREGERLNSLNARLIDLILLDEDEAVFAPLYIRALVSDAASAQQPAAADRGIRLTVQCDDAVIQADRTLLQILLANLLDNALKSGASAVLAEGRIHGGMFTLTVRDDGRGMDSLTLMRASEPFYRADKARSRAQGGAGLGLSLCDRIARLHNTCLYIQSTPGNGCAVSIILPAKEVEPDEDA